MVHGSRFQLCWMARSSSVAIFVIYASLILTHHAYGEASESIEWPTASLSFYDRFKVGPDGLTTEDLILVGWFVTLAFEFLDFCAKRSGIWLRSKQIPVRGKHLDVLSAKDILFIGFSKANTAPFTYFYFRYICRSSKIQWHWRQLSLVNTMVALTALFLVFDFVYTLLHWALHIQIIYGYIHKHHHHQKAPSRAIVDASNVHPIELVLGEYNHLLALWFCTSCLGIPVHAVTTVLFIAIGGALAAINHTRNDIVISCFNITLYDSKVHDVHHRIPQSNYGQYTMFWDHVFGSFRPYNPNDRVDPDAQLDPSTGKSLGFTQSNLKNK